VPEFTHLEKSVLDAICDAQSSALPGLAEVLSTAVVVSRENTGHGFYTNFRAASGTYQLTWPRPIAGPNARMIGLGDDARMGFLLWCSEDEPNSLEGFQYGDTNGQTVDLKALDLASLRFSELEWHPADRL
jgi:hypothetical protein